MDPSSPIAEAAHRALHPVLTLYAVDLSSLRRCRLSICSQPQQVACGSVQACQFKFATLPAAFNLAECSHSLYMRMHMV